MFNRSSTTKEKQSNGSTPNAEHIGSLQIILWAIWTAAVVATGWIYWHSTLHAQHDANIVGLVIYTSSVGMIGLIIITLIEMRLEPWRFWE